MTLNLNYNYSIKVLIYLFLLSIFSYIYYFSLNNIINYWTFSEIHINYSLGFVKRGLLGSLMLWFEGFGLSKKIFFSTIFYIFNISNILLFLSLLNRDKKNQIYLFIFFALNPALLLFSFYDLGGYARFEIFGIFSCILHTYIAQKMYAKKISYINYLKYIFFVIIPINQISVLIQEINILFLSFHFFSALFIIIKYRFQNLFQFKLIIFLNILLLISIIYLLLTHPFTNDFAIKLYDNLQSKDGTSFWIWEAISNSFSDRLDIEINRMSNPEGAIKLYFSIFLFFLIPILILLHISTVQNKYGFYLSFLSILPFSILFFIGQDWGRWFHIILMLIVLSYMQFEEKKIIKFKTVYEKIIFFIILLFIIFQFTFTRIPHCCNLVRLNLDMYGGILPKIAVFSKIINNKIDIEKRFKSF